ncbi:SCP2 sterol-binding domain-containing protein [Patulibacter sp. NPDC049589]|uniref:SCP2 sterol-binding domain-containing protein n=1 Tax=Patulibacter sp. NPDC049589 TaxID=3154731 RepID=UPI0034356743
MSAIDDVTPPGHRAGISEPTSTDHPAAQGPSGARSGRAWDDVVDVFERAADEPRVAEGVGRIGHSVLLSAIDVPDSGIVLVCRDGRIEVLDADGPGADHTIELAFATKDLERLAEGKLRAAMAIAAGRATYAGPVRQFLRVLPLVQAMVNPPDEMGTDSIHDGTEEHA